MIKNYTYDRIRPISEYLTSPSSTLHTDLFNTKQETFADNYRIVFSCFENLELGQIENFVVGLQKSLTFLDIPNFFVLVISNNPAVEKLLIDAHSKYSYEDNSIEFEYIESPIVEFNKPIIAILNTPESICAQPWISLDVTTQGEFRPCCVYKGTIRNNNNEPFRGKKDSFEDVYNSAEMKQLREDFRQGRKPIGCTKCWQEEADNTTSKRQLQKHRFKPHGHSANWEQDDISNLITVSIAFGNICNLKCRICSSPCSSQIATEAIEHSGLANKKDHPAYKSLMSGIWIKDDNAAVWEQLLDPNLKFTYMDIAGGEPMLSAKHFKVLQQLVDSGRSKDIKIHYNTNGSIFPEEHIPLLEQFKEIDIALSIDNIGKRFEYERPGVPWDIINNNISKYLSLSIPNIKISLNLVVNIQNVFYLPEMCDWIQSKKFDEVHFSTLYSPNHMNISNVTAEARDLILSKLSKYSNTAQQTSTFVTNVINILKSAPLSDGTEFCEYMKHLDKIREVNFMDSHSDIAIAMGYNRADTN